MLKVAFIGLGVMGYPMAGHLATKGYAVTVYNRTMSKAEAWVKQYQGSYAQTPREAAQGKDVVMCCVGNDHDVRAVTLGDDGAFAGMQKGSVFIDHTTASATLARELSHQASELGLEFLDAPVSGGQAGAQKGTLTIMVGGHEQAYNKVAGLMASYAQHSQYMGEAGNGQLTKMVNQICIAGLVQALSEGIHFAQGVGLDVSKVIATISRGAAQSWQMENRWQTMNENKFDFGFAVEWMRKDLSIVFDEATKRGLSLPVTQIVDSYYAQIESAGGRRWDTSSLITRLGKAEA